MHIMIIRHAQSRHNVGLDDNLDSEVTHKGRRQIFETSKWLQQRNEQFPEQKWQGWVSPFFRTLQTASGISAVCDIPFKVDKRIMEVGNAVSGYAPGTEIIIPNRRNEFPKFFTEDQKDDFIHKCEEPEELIARLQSFLDELSSHGNYHVIVTHGTPAHTLFNLLTGTKEVPPWDGSIKNCGITYLEDKTCHMFSEVKHSDW